MEDLPIEPDAANGTVAVVRYGPEEVILEANMPAPGVLVLSDTWYSGWRVEVDGSTVPLLQANLLLRGVLLGEGTHRLVFTFEPASLRLGSLVSGMAGLILGLLLLIGLLATRNA